MQTNIRAKFKLAKLVIGFAALAPLMGMATAVHAETASFCSKVDASATATAAAISEKEAAFASGKSAGVKALKESRAASDKALYDARVAANGEYAAQFKALLAEATTPEEKAAVAAFKKATLKAVETRRANVDIAIARYRAGIDAILAARSTSYLSALAELKIAVDQSLDCANAESSFQSKVAALGDSADAVKALATARDEKVAAAEAKFTATITAAATTLKAALGQ